MFYVGRSKLKILIDPLSIHLDASSELIKNQVSLTTVLHYLPGIGENKVDVEIFFPKFLWNDGWRENYYSFVPGDVDLDEPKKITIIKERKEIEADWTKKKVEKVRQYLEGKKGEYLKFPNIKLSDPKTLLKSLEDGSLLNYRDAEYIYKYGYSELVDLYYQYNCDLLLTNNRVLSAEKDTLAKKHKFFVTYYPEIFDHVETFLKGHNIYVSSNDPIYGLDASNFYVMTDVKLRRYFELWNHFNKKKNSPEMSEYLRVMFYHRYSFMKLSLDQIKFQLFQAERLDNERLRFKHYFLISYHLNSFYLNLWGFLDNLAWVFNYLYELGFTKKLANKVTFSGKDYKKKLKSSAPSLSILLNKADTKQWLDNLAIKRHPAAHREPLFLSPVYDQDTMNLISEQMVVVDTLNGRELFDAVKHLNYDLEKFELLMASVCDLFLNSKNNA